MNRAVAHTWSTLSADRPMLMLERRRIIGKHAMLSRITLRKGCVVPSHSHPNEQFACVLSGMLRFGIGVPGSAEHHSIDVGTGEVLHLPPNIDHSAEAMEDTIVLDVFSPPSAMTGIDKK